MLIQVWDEEMETILFYSTFIANANASVELGCRRREVFWNEVLE